MAFRLGARRGLQACATPGGQFVVLALDHRQNLRHELRPDAPDTVTYAQMVEFKLAVVRALAPSASGVLLDPEVGAAPAIASGALPGSTGLLVAIEATGYEGPSTARVSRVLPGWSVAAAKRIGASAAKLLIYYHPDAANAADQERLVAEVARACREEDLALFVEPLSFSLGSERLAGEERRRVVIETARRLTAIGGDVLKAEFPYAPDVTDPGPLGGGLRRARLREPPAVGAALRRRRRRRRSRPRSAPPARPARAARSSAGRSGRRRPPWPSRSARPGCAPRAATVSSGSPRSSPATGARGSTAGKWLPEPDMPGEGWYRDA